jgi:hypothetical protein
LLAADIYAYLFYDVRSATCPVFDQPADKECGNGHQESQPANYDEFHAH